MIYPQITQIHVIADFRLPIANFRVFGVSEGKVKSAANDNWQSEIGNNVNLCNQRNLRINHLRP